jgi:hypothetical protein
MPSHRAKPPVLRVLTVAPAVALLLAACGPGAWTPQPLAARLSADSLLLEMSGGQSCRVPRAAVARDGPDGWGGPVQGCAGVARVEVLTLSPGPVELLLAPVALGRLFAPQAEVRVTATDGRVHVFASPPEPHPRD